METVAIATILYVLTDQVRYMYISFLLGQEQVVLPVTPFPVLAFLNKSTKSANLKRLFNTFHLWVMTIVINSITLPPSPGSSECACYLYGIYTVVMVVF